MEVTDGHGKGKFSRLRSKKAKFQQEKRGMQEEWKEVA